MKTSPGFEVVHKNNDSHSGSAEHHSPPPPSERNKWQIVPIAQFEGNYEQALQFYTAQIQNLQQDNSKLNKQLRSSLHQKKQLADAIANFKEQERSDPEQNRKRVRRCANEIQRNYICPVAGCNKSYGAEGSMAQHLKFKHPEFKEDYEPSQSRNQSSKYEKPSGKSEKIKKEKKEDENWDYP